MTEEERAEIRREKDKASTAVIILAAGMALWAIDVFVDGGYTEQPEHHAMWRMVAILPGVWGVVLLIIFRYSWTNVICALALAISGFYLANAPTVTMRRPVRPSRVEREVEPQSPRYSRDDYRSERVEEEVEDGRE